MEASIILVIYNGLKYLPDCLNSLFTELDDDCEVIAVDNASADGSANYIQEHFPQVNLIKNGANIGFAAACNQGARAARGDFFIFLNQDTKVCSGWLEGLLAPFSTDASIGMATSKLLLMASPEQIHTCGQDIHYSGLSFARGILQPADEYNREEAVSAVSGASFAIRSELWRRLGGFDDRFFMYYEETDLCWRAWLAGYSSIFSPASTVYHDFRLKSTDHALYFGARNRWALLLKNWRISTLLLLAPGLLLAELVEWGLMVVQGRKGLTAKLRSMAWLVTHLAAILTTRYAVDTTRAKPDWYLLKQCSSILTPQLITGGKVGRVIIFLINTILLINYHGVLFVERWLGI